MLFQVWADPCVCSPSPPPPPPFQPRLRVDACACVVCACVCSYKRMCVLEYTVQCMEASINELYKSLALHALTHIHIYLLYTHAHSYPTYTLIHVHTHAHIHTHTHAPRPQGSCHDAENGPSIDTSSSHGCRAYGPTGRCGCQAIHGEH